MTHSSHRGFSLVELMVALAISMVAMVAVTELYLGTRQTYRVQAMQSRLSEDGRFALSILQRLVSQAGYRASSAAMPSRIKALSATSLQIAFAGDGTGTIACDGSPVGVARTVIISRSNTSLQCADGADEAAATAANKTDWIAPAGGNGTELADFRIGYGVDTEAKIKVKTRLPTRPTSAAIRPRIAWLTPISIPWPGTSRSLPSSSASSSARRQAIARSRERSSTRTARARISISRLPIKNSIAPSIRPCS